MTKNHRIAAGGITFKNNEVLLVRYPDSNGGSYLAAPGGGLEEHENIIQAIIRETKEETNIVIKPKRVVIIEDLTCDKFKMSKVWMLCDYIEGEIIETKESKNEGILEAAWFSKNQLKREIVYPEQLVKNEWNQLLSDKWQIECPPSREMKN